MDGAAENMQGGVLRLRTARAEGDVPIQNLKELRAKQFPDCSWARMVLVSLGRSVCAASTSGALSDRTPFGLLLPIASLTALV